MAIVVGVDGSEESNEALRWALQEASLRETPLRTLWVWELPVSVTPMAAPMGGMPMYEPLAPETADAIRNASAERLAAVVAEVSEGVPGAADVRVEQEVVEGHAAEVLVRESSDEQMLVVGSRGRGGLKGMLLGSVSQACAHHAVCPLVIVRPR